jgi:hypothetical protein
LQRKEKNMWIKSECIGHKPDEIDSTSSKIYVYVRKDFEESKTEEGAEKWTYMEQKILKEDWDTYKQVMANTSDVSDLTDAVIELAGIIGGE